MDVFSKIGGVKAGRHDVLFSDENSLTSLSSWVVHCFKQPENWPMDNSG